MGCASSSDAIVPTAVCGVTTASTEPTFGFAVSTAAKHVIITGVKAEELIVVVVDDRADTSCEQSLVTLCDPDTFDTTDEDASSLNFSKAQNSRVSALSSSGNNKSLNASPHRGESFNSFCQRMPRAAGVLRVTKNE
jgi:hypothetical protein